MVADGGPGLTAPSYALRVEPWLHRGRRIACLATCLAVIGLAAALALSFVPAPPFALAEHFRVQLAAGGLAVIAAAGGLVFGARWLPVHWFDAAVVALLVDACILVPDLAAGRRAVPDGAPVRVLVVNVLTENTRTARLQRLIAEEQPDVIGLVEVDARWLRELAPALAAYPSRIEAPRTDNFGLALYARGPLAGGVEHLGSELPSIVAEATHGGARLGIVLVHPIPPLAALRAPRTYARQAHHASHSQPARNASPPSGVTAPRAFTSVSASA